MHVRSPVRRMEKCKRMNYSLRKCLAPLVTLVLIACSLPEVAAQTSNSSLPDWPSFRKDWSNNGLSTAIGPASSAIQWCSEACGAGSTSAVAANGAIYTLAGGNLVAMDTNGNAFWWYACGATGQSSPAVGPDGTVYAVGAKYLYAFAPNGSPRWTFNLGCQTNASPVVGPDGTVYIGGSDNVFRAIASGGTLKFAYTAGGQLLPPPPSLPMAGCTSAAMMAACAQPGRQWVAAVEVRNPDDGADTLLTADRLARHNYFRIHGRQHICGPQHEPGLVAYRGGRTDLLLAGHRL